MGKLRCLVGCGGGGTFYHSRPSCGDVDENVAGVPSLFLGLIGD